MSFIRAAEFAHGAFTGSVDLNVEPVRVDSERSEPGAKDQPELGLALAP
jgi:hypothetical protein